MQQISAFLSGLAFKDSTARPSPALLLTAFSGTLFLSALLLFSVQPMFGKMALPLLGGTPAVWAISMCFFQAALLAGYCYAHAVIRWLTPSQGLCLHGAVLLATLLALPIGVPANIGEPPAGDAYFWLFGVLALGVGLPFFAVSATAPLLQAWFSKTGHKDAADPYFLYGASNTGSLIALMSYPLAVEPRIGLVAQSQTWSFGFIILGALIVGCGVLMLLSRSALRPSAQSHSTETDAQAAALPLTLPQRLTWVALAAIPSGLMVAVTTHIATDVASAPFIWVVPLALFLLTFILVFRARLPFNYEIAQALLPVMLLVLVFFPGKLYAFAAAIFGFFLAALICHRELYMRRPPAEHLTAFYIWMSVGGVIGGIFSALIAPQIFTSTIEFKLLLFVSLFCRPGVLTGLWTKTSLTRLALVIAGLAAVFTIYNVLVSSGAIATGGIALYAVIAMTLGCVYLVRNWPEHRAILVLTMLAAIALVPNGAQNILYSERSFFGQLRVTQTPDQTFNIMLHGTTIHGAERLKTSTGEAVAEPVPATYYAPTSPMARMVSVARSVSEARHLPFSAGVVGLGTGSLACYAKLGDAWTFYEIDPMVARVARNPQLFRFLSRCMPDNHIVFGDARLTLHKEPAQRFSYLVIDAFSSDAIPAHLLTREAMAMYFDKLAPGGVLAVHISNRYLDLGPAVANTAASLPGVQAVLTAPQPTEPIPDATLSQVVLLTRDADASAAVLKTWPDTKPLTGDAGNAWTDDYSDILSALTAGLKKRLSWQWLPF